MTDNFDSGSEDDFDVICTMVYVLPKEYDFVKKVFELEDCEEEEIDKHKPVCYFVMDNRCIEEHKSFFERPQEGMKSHMKPLFSYYLLWFHMFCCFLLLLTNIFPYFLFFVYVVVMLMLLLCMLINFYWITMSC